MRQHLLLPVALMFIWVAGCGRNSGNSKATDVFPDPKVAALANALTNNDVTQFEQLLRDGVNINATGKEGITLPFWTMRAKNKASFKWLFDHGADPNLVPPNDRGILFWTIAADDPDWLEILLQHKVNVNVQRENEGGMTKTPLLEAILLHQNRHLEMLIKAGADVNFVKPEKDFKGTPAMDAASIGWFEAVYVLLQAGADHRPKRTTGTDLTYFVVQNSVALTADNAQWREKVLQLLRERGADIDAAQKRVDAEEAEFRKDHPWLEQKGK